MKTSETIASIAPALLEAQKAITFAAKDSLNPHFKNKYADLSSVIDAVKSALNTAGIVFIQSLSPSEPGYLALSTRLLHSSGEWIEDIAVCALSKNDAQGVGSATTYLRRYSLAAITGVYQDDDDGNAASLKDTSQAKQSPKPKTDAKPAPINDQEMEITIAALRDAENVDELKTMFAAIWPRAAKIQQAILKLVYDKRKSALEISFGEQA